MNHNEIATLCRVALGALDLELEHVAIYGFSKVHADLGYCQSDVEDCVVAWAKQRKRDADGSVLTRSCKHDFGELGGVGRYPVFEDEEKKQ